MNILSNLLDPHGKHFWILLFPHVPPRVTKDSRATQTSKSRGFRAANLLGTYINFHFLWVHFTEHATWLVSIYSICDLILNGHKSPKSVKVDHYHYDTLKPSKTLCTLVLHCSLHHLATTSTATAGGSLYFRGIKAWTVLRDISQEFPSLRRFVPAWMRFVLRNHVFVMCHVGLAQHVPVTEYLLDRISIFFINAT